MDNIGDIIMGLSVLLTLAMLGASTLLAFLVMGGLWFITEMSFKKIFFIAFGTALILPILFGAVTIGTLQDEDVQQQISEGLREALPSTERLAEEIQDLQPVTDDERRALEDGTLSEEELERRIEERLQRVLPGADIQVDQDGVDITTSDDTVTIRID